MKYSKLDAPKKDEMMDEEMDQEMMADLDLEEDDMMAEEGAGGLESVSDDELLAEFKARGLSLDDEGMDMEEDELDLEEDDMEMDA